MRTCALPLLPAMALMASESQVPWGLEVNFSRAEGYTQACAS